jgi:hypothetical protein
VNCPPFPISLSFWVELVGACNSTVNSHLNFLVHYIAFQAIDGADGFQNTHQPQHYESAKFSIEQVCFIVKEHELFDL